MADYYKIADGADNEAGLLRLSELSPGLFQMYTGGLKTEWHDCELVRRAGDGHLAPIGLPYVVWIFPNLTPEEYQYLREHFGPPVTIRTLDKGAGVFGNFSGTLDVPYLVEDNNATWEAGSWYNVKLTIRDLVSL